METFWAVAILAVAVTVVAYLQERLEELSEESFS